MTVEELITLAELQSEESYEDSTWMKYINAGLDDLTPVAKILKSKKGITAATDASGEVSISISSDEDLSKAHEFLKVYFAPSEGNMRELRRLPYSDNYSEGWRLDSDNITLKADKSDTSATVKVDYYQKLQHVTSTSDDIATVSGLPDQYHNLLLHYCVARSQQKEEELNDKNDAFQEYIIGKQAMAVDRIWEMEPHMRRFVKNARVSAVIGGGG